MILRHCDQTISVEMREVEARLVVLGQETDGVVQVGVCPFCKEVVAVEVVDEKLRD